MVGVAWDNAYITLRKITVDIIAMNDIIKKSVNDVFSVCLLFSISSYIFLW